MSKKISNARKVMRDAFIDDPRFKQTYIDNVAMFLFDNITSQPLEDREYRNDLAETLIDLIFGE
jgi:hypothetical protein